MHQDDDKLALMRALLAAVDTGSLSQGADELGIAASSLSRRISRLEDFLGVQLLLRTTRSLKLTDAGAAYAASVRRILHDLDAADSVARGFAVEAQGNLRVHAPATFGHYRIIPNLDQFLRTYPGVKLQLTLLDIVPDLVGDTIDVAIQIGEPSHPDFIIRKLLSNRRILVAAPAYVMERGHPRAPADLGQHKCLVLSQFSPRDAWTLQMQNERVTVSVTGPLRVNSGEALFKAALQGHGVALLSEFVVEQAIARKELEVVLPGWEYPFADVFAVIPPQTYVARHVRAFIDHLATTVSKIPQTL